MIRILILMNLHTDMVTVRTIETMDEKVHTDNNLGVTHIQILTIPATEKVTTVIDRVIIAGLWNILKWVEHGY